MERREEGDITRTCGGAGCISRHHYDDNLLPVVVDACQRLRDGTSWHVKGLWGGRKTRRDERWHCGRRWRREEEGEEFKLVKRKKTGKIDHNSLGPLRNYQKLGLKIAYRS